MCLNCIPTQTCVAAEERVTAPEDSPFAGDSWSNWEPDPQQAFREHDPSLEPYALMSREEVIRAMIAARGGRHWEALREFVLDQCSEDERRYDRFIAILKGDGNPDRELLVVLNEVAGMATRVYEPRPDPIGSGGLEPSCNPPAPCDSPSRETASQ